VIVCDDWTPEQVRGFRLLANRSAAWAEWDLSAVAEELAELRALHFDLTLTGFDPKEIENCSPRAPMRTYSKRFLKHHGCRSACPATCGSADCIACYAAMRRKQPQSAAC
jgi:hypothetical protein